MKTYLYLTSIGCLGVLIMFYVKSMGIILLSRMGHNVKSTWGGGGGAWGKFNDQTEPIVLSQVSSNPYQGACTLSDAKTISTFSVSI